MGLPKKEALERAGKAPLLTLTWQNVTSSPLLPTSTRRLLPRSDLRWMTFDQLIPSSFDFDPYLSGGPPDRDLSFLFRRALPSPLTMFLPHGVLAGKRAKVRRLSVLSLTDEENVTVFPL